MNLEYQAAYDSWAVADFDELAVIRMSGPDRLEFLQRLLTNDVTLRPGENRHAYYLTVQGRPLAEFFLFEQEQETLLLTPREQVQAAWSELDKMHFGEKLRFAIDDTKLVLSVGPQRPAPPGLALRPSRPLVSPPHDLWIGADVPSGATVLTAETLRILRWEAGRALLSELGEKTMFLEIARVDDYSETKGCYPGQEVVARTLHRGHINKKLCPLKASGLPSANALLRREGQEAGIWLCGSKHPLGGYFGLGIVRRGSWDPATVFDADGLQIEVVEPKGG